MKVLVESFKLDLRRVVPGDGIEPSTPRSSGACSTTELPRHYKLHSDKNVE